MIERPRNVRIRRGDGTVISCELTYLGTDDENGYPTWGVATPMDHAKGDKLLVGYWPPNCNIEVPSATLDPVINPGELPVEEDGEE